METYKWETEIPLNNNMETMGDYLENHMDIDIEIILEDGTYAEIKTANGKEYEVHASGDGDFTHHKVEFVEIESR